MLFGDRLRKLREDKGLIQAELGKLIGVSDRVVGYYEANVRFPKKPETLQKISNVLNAEGKISTILSYLSDEFNNDETLNLNDEIDDAFLRVFNIFPQGFIDSDSLYVVPISKRVSLPEELDSTLGITAEQRELHRLALQEKSKNRFSRKNINHYIEGLLKDNKAVLASSLPLANKRDLIKIIFISLYGRDKKSIYKTTLSSEIIAVDKFQFNDFLIERCE